MSEIDVRGTNWSVAENIATIDAYFLLFKDDLAGKKINKSAAYRQLSQRFGRSPGAYGRKMSNISAILQDLGWPIMDGLKPANHYQRSLQTLLSERLEESSLDETVRRTLQAKLPPLHSRFDLINKSSPELNRTKLVESKDLSVVLAQRDYLEIEAANRDLGLHGETLVVEHEKRVLRSLGKHMLSERVEHVSVTRGDGLGYDVVSFEPSGKEKFIEVKTTNYGKYTPFFLTPNEVQVSSEIDDQYHLYRLYNLKNSNKNRNLHIEYYSLLGSLANAVDLVPASYRAFPNQSHNHLLGYDE